MPKIRSFEIALLETSIFGVHQGCTEQFIVPKITWVLGIFNICCSVTLTYLIPNLDYLKVDGILSINFIARKAYFYVALPTVIIFQIRNLLRRYKMTPSAQKLYHLYQLSTWSSDIYGCIERIVHYLGGLMLHHCLPVYADEIEGKMAWRILQILFQWSNFVPTAMTEFTGQVMLLFQHELKVLRELTEGMIMRKDYEIEELRILNRRHASLFALFKPVARFAGIDSLLIIESERYLILLTIFVQVNLYLVIQLHWTQMLLDCAFCTYRIERVIHQCFRGHRLLMEANRFASTLDKIDPLTLENDELFIELQIFRKQVRLRKLQFDCNRFLQLDMKLILQISRDLLTVIIILVQLTTNSPIATAEPANATEADNVTEYFPGTSDLPSSSFAIGNN